MKGLDLNRHLRAGGEEEVRGGADVHRLTQLTKCRGEVRAHGVDVHVRRGRHHRDRRLVLRARDVLQLPGPPDVGAEVQDRLKTQAFGPTTPHVTRFQAFSQT